MPAFHGFGTRKLAMTAIAAALAAWLGTGAAAPASAQVSLRLHTHVPPVSSSFKNLKWWAEQVEKASGGKIKITAFGSNQLGGKAADIYDQVAQGVVDIGWTLPGYLPGRFPDTEVFELPFVGGEPSYVAPAVMEFYQDYLKDKEFKDTHVLVLHAGGSFVLHSKSKPVRTLADMRGMKIRTSSRLTSDIVTALGGTPVAIPGINIAEEMIRGVIDAALLPWNIALPIHMVDVAKFHTEANLTQPVLALVMNKESYAKLPADDRAVIDKEFGHLHGQDLRREVAARRPARRDEGQEARPYHHQDHRRRGGQVEEGGRAGGRRLGEGARRGGRSRPQICRRRREAGRQVQGGNEEVTKPGAAMTDRTRD